MRTAYAKAEDWDQVDQRAQTPDDSEEVVGDENEKLGLVSMRTCKLLKGLVQTKMLKLIFEGNWSSCKTCVRYNEVCSIQPTKYVYWDPSVLMYKDEWTQFLLFRSSQSSEKRPLL